MWIMDAFVQRFTRMGNEVRLFTRMGNEVRLC